MEKVYCRCCGGEVRSIDGYPIHTKCIPKHWSKHRYGINASRCLEFKGGRGRRTVNPKKGLGLRLEIHNSSMGKIGTIYKGGETVGRLREIGGHHGDLRLEWLVWHGGKAEEHAIQMPMARLSDVDEAALKRMWEKHLKPGALGLQRNPATTGSPGAGLYASFHGMAPQTQKTVYFENPKGPMVAIGRLTQLEYTPEGATQHKGVKFFHKSGDVGNKMLKSNLIVCTDAKGENIYLVKENPNSSYPRFSDRGILG